MTAVNAIADEIQRQEGWYPGSLAYRQNNPGNLKYDGQPGATLGEKGFAKYQDYATGRAGLIAQMELDASRGHTLSSFMAKYAPSNENDTTGYIAAVSNASGIRPDQLLSDAFTGEDSGDVNPEAAGLTPAELLTAGGAAIFAAWLFSR